MFARLLGKKKGSRVTEPDEVQELEKFNRTVSKLNKGITEAEKK